MKKTKYNVGDIVILRNDDDSNLPDIYIITGFLTQGGSIIMYELNHSIDVTYEEITTDLINVISKDNELYKQVILGDKLLGEYDDTEEK